MTLSPEMREQLRRRTEELRTEVSSLTAERDAAFLESSNNQDDAKLIAEVHRLEREAEVARAERDRAVNSTDDAMKIMIEAIEKDERARVAKSENDKAIESGASGESDKKADAESAPAQEETVETPKVSGRSSNNKREGNL